jgi:hypothetical protein
MLFNNPLETILVVTLISLAFFWLLRIYINLVRGKDIQLVELGGFLMIVIALGLLSYIQDAGFFAPTQVQAMPAMPEIPQPVVQPTHAPEPTVTVILPLPAPVAALEPPQVEEAVPVVNASEGEATPEMVVAAAVPTKRVPDYVPFSDMAAAAVPFEHSLEIVMVPEMMPAEAAATAVPEVYVAAVPTLTWPVEVLYLGPESSWNPAKPAAQVPVEEHGEIVAVLTGSYAARAAAYATGDFSLLVDYFTGLALEYEILRIAAFRNRYDCSQELHLEAPLRVDVSVYKEDYAHAFLTKQESRICHRNGEVDPAPNLTVYDDFYAVELALKRIEGRWFISERPYP